MIKTFCNKCGKQLKYGDHRKVELTVRPYTTYGGRFNLDYCESCFKEIIGEEEYNAMIQKEIVHKRRIEEKKRSETMTLDNLDLKQREIDEYNKKHKTHYSYGMYCLSSLNLARTRQQQSKTNGLQN